MSPEKQREIASKGGRAAHQKGTAHEWTSEEARIGRTQRWANQPRRPRPSCRLGRNSDAIPPAATLLLGRRISDIGSRIVALGRRVRMLKRFATATAMAIAVVLTVTATAAAQTSAPPQSQTSSTQSQPDPSSSDLRPATTTFMGDTGLWFVPTGEVLPAKRWSVSGYRVNFDHQQGFTDVSNWPVTFGFGVGDRAEIFGAWTVIRRIDRDARPIFLQDSQGGWFGQRVPVRAPGLVRQSARRLLGWRQGQPDVRVEAEAGGDRRPRHDEAADGEE